MTIEAIVVVVFPTEEKLVHGTGALLSRDYYEEVVPAHTEIHKREFRSVEEFNDWLNRS